MLKDNHKSIKISLSKILVFFMMLYCFSINSYQALIPSNLRVIFLLGMPVLLMTVIFILEFCPKLKIRKSIPIFSAIGMILVMLFWNNHTIRSEGIMGMYGQIIPILFFLACCSKCDWYEEFLDLMIFFGMFYSAFTIICLAFPSLYYNGVAPLMIKLYPQIEYDISTKAGFTAHYSTNGMYLANGIIATITKWIMCEKTKKRHELFILLLIQISAFLICGKRGTLLCVVIGCYVAYFLYETNRPKGRIFKLFVFSFCIIVVIYICSLVVPALANAYLHMIEMSERDDISTGRFDLWVAAWRDFLESPIVGHGWRWFYYYDKSVFANHDVHNCYLQFLTETGILGSIPFYLFFFVNYYRAFCLMKNWRLGKMETVLAANDYNPLIFCIIYQTFYLIFIFEGTAFFNPEALIPYVASCAMVEYYQWKYKKMKGLGMNDNVCG